MRSSMISQWQLRASFARRLSAMYGREVPAYTTLVEVSEEVNTDIVRRTGADAERLGSISRITAERHGAIRVGTPRELGQVARIGGVRSTHVNHLTPRVLDIDELYRRMSERGIEMIDAIQGPPRWDGPDVLLRQTSFRALAEPRALREPDGTVTAGALRVRFGEVEARGIALTRAGRGRYDAMLGEIDRILAESPDRVRADVAREVWENGLPATERGLLAENLGFFTFALRDDHPAGSPPLAWLAGAIDRPIDDPFDLYERQQNESIHEIATALQVSGRITDPGSPIPEGTR
jgi:uncharacterized glyoxalase superfamily metalloenzyme YdcJ